MFTKNINKVFFNLKHLDAKLYTNYHNFVMDYLHSKWNENTYNANVNEYARAYGFDKDTEMYQIEREMVADNGMAVFSDEEALKTLAGENRTLLQKILDFFNEFIGRLDNALRGLAKTSVVYNEVKADRQFLLESAKRIKAMLDSVENNTATQSDTTQFSIRTIVDENGKNYGKGVYLDSNILDGLDETARKAKIAQYINEMGGQGFYATDRNGKPVLIEIPTSKKFKNNSGKMKKANGDLIRKNNNSIVKLQVMSLIDETIQLSKYDNQSPPKYPHGWLDNKGKTNWEYYTVIVQEKNKTIWSATLNVTTTANGNKILYDIMPIKKVEPGVKSPATTVNSISQNQNNVNTKFSKNTALDSAGNELTNEQQEYFKDSKVRDENGNLLVVYHGSNADFTVFDKTKGRANMDIQGSFFSPWELDASGYGSNVKAYYLNITNPADEQTGYRALKKYQGQNNAGIKAREYLESLGYDGVNNENEEYIAFNSNQIKLVENAVPTNKSDIRYSKTTNFAKALTGDERKKYNNAIMTGNDNGLRISDNSILVECENNSSYQYKYVVYDEFEDGPVITDVYAIGKIDTNVEDDVPSQCHNIAKYINELRETGYDNRKVYGALLRARIKDTSYLLAEYSNRTNRYNVIGRGSVKNGTNTLDQSDRGRSTKESAGSISSDTGRNSRKLSRNTYTRATVGLEDSNEILEQGLKMLAGIKNIDFNSNIVDLVGKANANLNKQGLADFKASKMYNKNSVNDIAKLLKSEYASTARTGYIRQMLTDLYDYMANSTEQDLDYMNSQAKVIARELISTSTHVVENDYNELHDYVGAKPFSVSEEIKQSFAKEYGSWSEAKAAVIPNLKVRNNAISLSQYYNDLAKEFPGISAGEFSNVLS